MSGPLADDDRRTAVYAGELLVFTAVPPLRELWALTDTLIRDVFGDLDPLRAQFRLDPDQHATRVTALQREYRRHPDVKRLFLSALAHVGVDLERTYWDRLHARVAVQRQTRSGRSCWSRGRHRPRTGRASRARRDRPLTPKLGSCRGIRRRPANLADLRGTCARPISWRALSGE